MNNKVEDKQKVKFVVVVHVRKSVHILDLEACVGMYSIKRVDTLSEKCQITTKEKIIDEKPYHISINVNPIVCSSRRVP